MGLLRFDKFGLKIDSTWLLEFGYGSIIAAIQICLFFAIIQFSGYINSVEFFYIAHEETSFIPMLASQFSRYVFGVVIEELLTRSFLLFLFIEMLQFRHIKGQKSVIISVMITCVFFGVAHLFNENAYALGAINLIVDGLILAAPFLISGRLGMSVGMHFSWIFFKIMYLASQTAVNHLKPVFCITTFPNRTTLRAMDLGQKGAFYIQCCLLLELFLSMHGTNGSDLTII